MINTPTRYFGGLDTLRFVAASIVVFCHIELVKYYRGYTALVSESVIYECGKIAVGAFFVLSGFLITYLLLAEKEKNASIKVGKFYMRRGLRIWPLYYLLVAIIFFVLPRFSAFYLPQQTEELTAFFSIKLVFFALLLPQLLFVGGYKPVPGAEQFWTIGSEEIFYFLWPLALKKIQKPLFTIVALIAAYHALKYFCFYYSGVAGSIYYKAYLVFYYNRVDCLLVGALIGLLIHNCNDMWCKFAGTPIGLMGGVAFLAVTFFYGVTQGGSDYFFYALCFAFIISWLVIRAGKNIRAPGLTEFLGKISYSVYMWHFIAVLFSFYLLKSISGKAFENTWGQNVLLYLLSYGITYTISAISYLLVERLFLKWKEKWRA